MFASFDKNKIINVISDHPIEIGGKEINAMENIKPEMIGRKIKLPPKKPQELKIAIICNWNVPCGISTYTKFLIEALIPKVKEVMVFSEQGEPLTPDGLNIVRSWERGKSMRPTLEKLTAWNPDFVIIQHEYGIFPNACFFLQMLQLLDSIPYVVTMHSVYEHLDKTICSSPVKNMIVHSEDAKKTLFKHGHQNKVFVIPHGCSKFEGEELWNIFHTPYTVIQFGFGFFYKGVDRAMDAIHHLKSTDKKFKDIFYCYLCAENPHNTSIHDQYYNFLLDKAKDLGIEDNMTIIRGYQSDKTINNYLRTSKLAIFPYVNNPNNTVFGASGAVRIAMANQIPIVASESHLFDDLEGIVPRPSNYLELATEIDKIFSNEKYKNNIVGKIDNHIKEHSWDYAAECYLNCYKSIL